MEIDGMTAFIREEIIEARSMREERVCFCNGRIGSWQAAPSGIVPTDHRVVISRPKKDRPHVFRHRFDSGTKWLPNSDRAFSLEVKDGYDGIVSAAVVECDRAPSAIRHGKVAL